jgi:hypothetical protein
MSNRIGGHCGDGAITGDHCSSQPRVVLYRQNLSHCEVLYDRSATFVRSLD